MTKRLLRERELMEYLGVGRSTARRFGAEAGAIVRFGRRVAYDRILIDAAINKKTGQAVGAPRPGNLGKCVIANQNITHSPT